MSETDDEDRLPGRSRTCCATRPAPAPRGPPVPPDAPGDPARPAAPRGRRRAWRPPPRRGDGGHRYVGADRAAPPPGPAGTPTAARRRRRAPRSPGRTGTRSTSPAPTAGSLAATARGSQGMKQRLVRDGVASDPAHARVLWATDHEGRRYALTIAAARSGGDREVARGGRRGTGGDGDHRGRLLATGRPGPPSAGPQFVSFRASDDATKGPGVLVGIGERLSDVEVASGFDYAADGRKTATWRPLEPEAAVWTREVTAEEIDGMDACGHARWRRPAPASSAVAERTARPPAGRDGGGGARGYRPRRPDLRGDGLRTGARRLPEGSTPVLGAAPEEDEDVVRDRGGAGAGRGLPRRLVSHAAPGVEQLQRGGERPGVRRPGAGGRAGRRFTIVATKTVEANGSPATTATWCSARTRTPACPPSSWRRRGGGGRGGRADGAGT